MSTKAFMIRVSKRNTFLDLDYAIIRNNKKCLHVLPTIVRTQAVGQSIQYWKTLTDDVSKHITKRWFHQSQD